MFTQQFFIDGLACASYLVGCDSKGIAAVIDPDRDVRKYLQAAERRGLKITHIIETHLHADHVSGNTDLAQRTGADIYIHEASGAEFPHKPLQHDDVLALGNVRIRAVHTPGHTPESVTLLVSDTTRAEEPWLALTGDTLFVGDIGRPDLVGPEAARGLANDMYSSLFEKILPLNDNLMIYPGHGAGSLCGKSIGAMRSTTLGFERKYNTALSPRRRDEFVEFATEELPEQPGNHALIAIEVAAARVRLFSPQALLERLGIRLNMLRGGARDLPLRQQTLRDAIDWSYELLDPVEQRLFELLSAFSGGCTFEAAEGVASEILSLDNPGVDTLDGLASLLDKSLIRQVDQAHGEARLVMLETIREFALERLEKNPGFTLPLTTRMLLTLLSSPAVNGSV